MESTFVWILMFAGAAVALLGLFLVASERELKNKRREIDGLLARLEASPQNAAAAAGQSEPDVAAADLRAQNLELESKLSTLSSQLTQSRQTIDALQAERRDTFGEQDENRRLSSANEQLARELGELRSRLAAGDNGQHDSGAAVNRMEAEIAELRRTLETSHAKIQELEAAQQNLPDLKSIEAERNNYREQIAELQKRLATEQQHLSEMQSLRDRLAEAERAQASLRAEISRHEDDIPRWQARIAAAEESRERLAALQGPCNELLSRHAELADRQRRLQEELTAFAQQISGSSNNFPASNSTFVEPVKTPNPVSSAN